MFLVGCQAEAASQEALEITVTWDSESESMSEVGSGSESETEPTSMTGGETTTGGPDGTMSESESGTTTAMSSTTSDPTNTSEPADCGDGQVQVGEQCDDGNDENSDECTNACLLPMCGDGFVGPNEECDDGNQKDDGCNTACARDRVVFVSSEAYFGDLSGIDGAINRCRERALEAGFENAIDFRPWISGSEYSPSTHFFKSEGRYVLVDGTKVADNWNDLVDGGLEAPIDMDESGQLLDGVSVWTNTVPWGEQHPDMAHCSEWTSDDLEPGQFGKSNYTDERWSAFGDTIPCALPAHLYCFEQ